MKKALIGFMFLIFLCSTSNSFAFLDYLFSGSSSRDAIDNNVVGDLRSWWSGNPAYQFNPYYSGAQQFGQNQGQQAAQPAQPPQPTINYYPPSQAGGQYQPQYQPQGMAPQQPAQYGYSQPQQMYQGPQQAYQAPPGVPQYPQQQMGPPQSYQYYNQQ